MNRSGLIINIVLLVAVGVLYFLHFSSKGKGGDTIISRRVLDTSTTAGAYRIAYFDIDSITNNYEYCIDVRDELDLIRQATDKKVAALQNDFDMAYGRLQEKAATQKISDADLDREKEILNEKQQAVTNEKEKGTNAYEQNRRLYELKIKNRIVEFLREYNTPQRFAFIMADEPGIFYYRDSLYNITADVLDGLNRQYKRKGQ